MPHLVRIWLQASRPKTLPAALAPVAIGSALAWRGGAWNAPAVGACLLGALALQIGANFSNDYYDGVRGTDTPDRVGPTRAVAAGLVSPVTMLWASWVAFAVAAVAAALLMSRIGWPVWAIWAAGVACAILYTGGPWPLGYHGLGDITAFLFFGPVAVLGTFVAQAGGLTPAAWLASFVPGLFAVALITINNLRDREGDEKAGKHTLAVRLGATFARVEYTGSMVIAFLLPFLVASRVGMGPGTTCLTLIAAPVALIALVQVWRGCAGAALNRVLALTGLTLLLHGVCFALALRLG